MAPCHSERAFVNIVMFLPEHFINIAWCAWLSAESTSAFGNSVGTLYVRMCETSCTHNESALLIGGAQHEGIISSW